MSATQLECNSIYNSVFWQAIYSYCTCSLSRTVSCVRVHAAPSWVRGLCAYSKNSSTSCTGRTPGLHSNWSALLYSRGAKKSRVNEVDTTTLDVIAIKQQLNLFLT